MLPVVFEVESVAAVAASLAVEIAVELAVELALELVVGPVVGLGAGFVVEVGAETAVLMLESARPS